MSQLEEKVFTSKDEQHTQNSTERSSRSDDEKYTALNRLAPKEHIHNLFSKKAKADDNSTSLAQTLEKDIHTAFKGGHKFVYELLQNADDAAPDSTEIAASIIYIPARKATTLSYLIFTHTGRHFTANDVEKIANNAQQTHQDKAANVNKTGYKGIGFKAVFSISDRVQIISADYNFRFDRNYAQWLQASKGQLFPWPIIPIWTEESETPHEVTPFITKGNVNFIIALKQNSDIQDDLKFIVNNPHLILFLRSIKTLEIQIDQTKTMIQAIDNAIGRTTLSINGKIISRWLRKEIPFPIPKKLQESLNKMNEYECPRRLKVAETTALHFAAQLDEKDRICPVINSQLFCYLPTQVRTAFAYYVNGNFLLNAERTQLLENEWNEFLIKNIAYSQFLWLAELTEVKEFRYQILKLMSDSIQNVPDGFANAFHEGFKNGIQNVKFISQYKSAQLSSISNLTIDEIEFYKYVPIEVADRQIADRQIADHQIESLERLKSQKEIRVFGVKEFFSSLLDYAQRNITISFQKSLITYLFDILINRFPADLKSRKEKLGNISFILTNEQQLMSPNALYFLPAANQDNIPAGLDIHFVHPDLLQIPNSKNNLNSIGVREPSLIELVRGYIFRLISEHKIDRNNAITVTCLVFKAFQQSYLNDDDWKVLQGIPVLTQQNNLKTARELYLSDQYQPDLSLKPKLNMQDIFVSTFYSDEKNDPNTQEWKKFFLQLGVNGNITFYCRKYTLEAARRDKGKVFERYLDYIKSKGWAAVRELKDEHFIVDFLDCNLFHYLNYPNFLPLFMQALIGNWNYIEKHLKSQYRMPSRTPPPITEPYLSYYLQNEKCIPTTDDKLAKGTELYSPAFRDLSKFLPVANLEMAMSDEQIKFFGFRNTLKVDECISILNNLNKTNETNINQYTLVLKWIVKLKSQSELSREDESSLRNWKGNLPAQNGTLQPKHQLKCFAIKNNQASADSAGWLKEFPGMSQEDLVMLSELLNIQVVGKNVMQLNAEKEEETPRLKDTLMQFLPTIARIEAHTLGCDEKKLFKEFVKRLSSLIFFKANRISLYHTADPEIVVPIFAYLDDHKLYVKVDWRNNRTLPQFCKVLAEYFHLSDKIASLLPELFREEIDELSDWLREKQYNSDNLLLLTQIDSKAELSQVQHMPSQKDELAEITRSLAEVKISAVTLPSACELEQKVSLTQPSLSESPVASVALYSLVKTESMDLKSTPIKSPVSAKKWQKFAVEAVIRDVKIHSDKKTQTSSVCSSVASASPSQDTRAILTEIMSSVSASDESSDFVDKELTNTDKKAIGDWGEKLVFEALRMKYKDKYSNCTLTDTEQGFKLEGRDNQNRPIILEIVWSNKKGESYEAWDIKINKNGKQRIIEVKTTQSSSKSILSFSEKELKLMKAKPDSYYLFRVYNAGKQNPRIEKIRKVAEKIDKGEIVVSSLQVKL